VLRERVFVELRVDAVSQEASVMGYGNIVWMEVRKVQLEVQWCRRCNVFKLSTWKEVTAAYVEPVDPSTSSLRRGESGGGGAENVQN
jgi:hypothetical protein